MQFSNIHILLVTGVFTLIFLSSIAYFDTLPEFVLSGKKRLSLALGAGGGKYV